MTKDQANELLMAAQALVTVYSEDYEEGDLPETVDCLLAELQIIVEEIEGDEDDE